MSAAAAIPFIPRPVVTWTRKPRIDFPKYCAKGRMTAYDRAIFSDIVESQQLGRSTAVSALMERTGACEKTVYNCLERLECAKLMLRDSDPGKPTRYIFPWAFACGKRSAASDNPEPTPVRNYSGTPVRNTDTYPYKQKQAEESSKNTEQQSSPPPVEKTFQRSPELDPVTQTDTEQAEGQERASVEQPQAKTEGNYQTLVREAVQRWKMDKDVAPTCPAEELRIALAIMPERVQQARQRGTPIKNTGAYLRAVIERMTGCKLPDPPIRSAPKREFRAAGDYIRNMFESQDDFANWQRSHERKQPGREGPNY